MLIWMHFMQLLKSVINLNFDIIQLLLAATVCW
ncbi:unnamed protein product [Trichobilharzia regenti]|nr:unnamed protein product [Trichobilharzia regenti]